MEFFPAGFDPNIKWKCSGCYALTSGITCPSCETLHPDISPESYAKYQEAEKQRLRQKLFGNSAGTSNNVSFFSADNNVNTTSGIFCGKNQNSGTSIFGNNSSSASIFGNVSNNTSIFGNVSETKSFSFAAPSGFKGFGDAVAEEQIEVRTNKNVSAPVDSLGEPLCAVYIHGNGECDQLGMGETRERRKPTLMPGLKDLRAVGIYSGTMHTLALLEDGRVFSWGCNDAGALGREGADEVPFEVKNLPTNIVYFTCGDSHTLGLTSDGNVWMFGCYNDSQGAIGVPATKKTEVLRQVKLPIHLNLLPPMKMISSGTNHTAALDLSGRLWMWGDSECGQLGMVPLEGGHQEELLKPIVRDWRDLKLEAAIARTIAVRSGTYLIDENGNIYGCGLNTYGQVGLGSNQELTVNSFKKLSTLPTDSPLKSIASTCCSACAILEDGRVFSWGRPDLTGLDKDQNQSTILFPTQIKQIYNAKDISCGLNHTMVVTNDGGLYTFGIGSDFILGNATPDQEMGDDSLIPYFMNSQKLDDKFIVHAVGGSQHTVELGWIENAYRSPGQKRAVLGRPLLANLQRDTSDKARDISANLPLVSYSASTAPEGEETEFAEDASSASPGAKRVKEMIHDEELDSDVELTPEEIEAMNQAAKMAEIFVNQSAAVRSAAVAAAAALLESDDEDDSSH